MAPRVALAVHPLHINARVLAVARAGEDKPFTGRVDRDVGIETFVGECVLLKTFITHRLGRATRDAVELTEDIDLRRGGGGFEGAGVVLRFVRELARWLIVRSSCVVVLMP